MTNRSGDDDQLETGGEAVPDRERGDGGPVGDQPRGSRGGVHLDHGALGLRQEHAAEPDGSAGRALEREDRHRRAGGSVATPTSTWRAYATKASGSSSRAFTWCRISACWTTCEIPLLYRKMSGGARRDAGPPGAGAGGAGRAAAPLPVAAVGRAAAAGGRSPGRSWATRAVLLADEPTGNLDSQMGDEIMGILKDLHKDEKTTIVMVTHDERLAAGDRTDRAAVRRAAGAVMLGQYLKLAWKVLGAAQVLHLHQPVRRRLHPDGAGGGGGHGWTTCWGWRRRRCTRPARCPCIGRAACRGTTTARGPTSASGSSPTSCATCPGWNGSPTSATWRGFTSRLKSSSHAVRSAPTATTGRCSSSTSWRAARSARTTCATVGRWRSSAAATARQVSSARPAACWARPSRWTSQRFRVVGVVRDVSSLRKFGFADIWAPITTEQGAAPRPEWLGGGIGGGAADVDPRPSPRPSRRSRSGWGAGSRPTPEQFRRMQAALDTRFENTARDIFGDDVDTVDHSGKLWALLGAVIACFHAAADGEPDQPERQPHPGTGLGDRRAQVVRGHRRARWWGSSWSRTWC